LSITASEVRTKRADVPGVTWSRTRLMNASSMPTSLIIPVSPPTAAPTAIPRNGTKKIRPNNMPQNAPPSAPAPARSFSWRVFGLFLPSGHDTVAASWTLMSSWLARLFKVATAWSAPSGVLNFHALSVAMCSS
jgi:hypothetical protein